MKYDLKVNFLCPHCREYLRVCDRIILVVSSNARKLNTLLLLDPELGNYNLVHHSSIKFKEGELLNFMCPICRTDFTATEINNNLARIAMIDENSKEYYVYFSKICGEHSTFLIHNDNVIEKYGKDHSLYVDYFISKLRKGKPEKSD